MTQYNTWNVKLSNSQLNKLMSGIKIGTEVTLKISLNVSSDENIFPHKLLLTNTQVSNLRKAFANNFSANIKLSKTRLHKIGQSGGFLGRLLGPLLKTGLPLIENVLKPLAKSVLIPIWWTSAASATDVVIHKKTFGSNYVTKVSDRARPSDLAKRPKLRISNEEMNDIMKIFKSLEEFGLLIKGVSETIKNKAKEQTEGVLRMLLGTLSAILSWTLLACKDIVKAGECKITAGEGTGKAGQNF